MVEKVLPVDTSAPPGGHAIDVNPYTPDDMPADTVGLMDPLKIRRARIIGTSMGGMIAQLVTIHYPDRALSLTS